MNVTKEFPTCAATECANCEKGQCIALTDNNFGTRRCPFFKTREQAAMEREQYEKRLAEIRIGKQEDK